MAYNNIPAGTSSGPLTSSAKVITGDGALLGIFISSTTSGTIKAWDNTAGSGTVLFDTITPAAGWLPVNMVFRTGLYLTLGNTISCVAVTVP